MAVVPYVFANAVGQIPLSELDINFANCKAFAETSGNVTGNIQANITALGTLTSLTASGNIVAPNFVGNLIGNISGNLVVTGSNTQVLFNDSGVANATAGMTFNKSSNAFAVTGNVTGGNLRTTGTISATANIITNTAVVATGSVNGSTLFATGGNIGVPPGVTTLRLGNTNPDTVWIGGGATNIFIANVNSVTQVSGNLVVGANFSTTGNVLGGNLSTTGNTSSGNLSVAGNIVSGNLSITGNSTLTGAATAPTAANGTSTTQVATTAFVQNSLLNLLPSGVIVMWSGTIASIPTGWVLCNGANSTPDLRDRFVVGAGNTYAVAATGGNKDATVIAHTHVATSTVSDPGHSHSYTAPVSGLDDSGGFLPDVLSNTVANTGSATTGITVSTAIASTGGSATNANLPPYYALAYIMKT